MSFDEARSVVNRLLKQAIAQETRLTEAALQDDEPFETYGIESVMMVAITRRLEESFGELSKTLFFEYQTIGELTDYLAEEYTEVLQKFVSPASQVAVQASNSVPATTKDEPSYAVIPSVVTDKKSDRIPVERYEEEANTDQNIAIIGVSGRFPKANDLEEFWKNLQNGTDCITEVPPTLWDWKEFWDKERGKEGKSYSKWGGFMDDVDKFDPLFFNISNLEAETLDPQERLFLETVYHTIEDAGYTRDSLRQSKVGVYVGAMWGQYQLYSVERANAGSSYASIANRVSYFFDFHGPSIALDTMCSSSLTTVHLACESLRRGETDVAIAGGVNITVHPNKYLFLSKTGFASTDGRCRSFGEGGDGYVPGDGVGALMLKPLRKAKADGDQIYAVIKSTAINHGGKVNGYTVPNPNAQVQLIQEALEKAKINPRTISLIEAHGTGTALGDPIEVRALASVFEKYTDEKGFCPIGSVKSNIGHLESAAGFAGIAKVLLQMKHRQLVPSIHSDRLNPNIDFAKTPFYVQKELSPWPTLSVSENGRQVPRRAGVSSFGAGGANAFVILEEYVSTPSRVMREPESEQLIVLSAKNGERLRTAVENFSRYLANVGSNGSNEPSEGHIRSVSTLGTLIQEWLAKVLGVSPQLMEDDDSLDDLGFTEDLLHRMTQFANAELGLNLTAEDLVDSGTLGGLKQRVEHRYAGQENSDHDLPRFLEKIAYTLQVGREAMNSRLAIVVRSIEELQEKLRQYLSSHTEIENLWQGLVSPREAVSLAGQGDQTFVSNLLEGRKLAKLAKMWCKGVSVPWEALYGEPKPQRISLPLYPFAKERCWVSNPTPTMPQERGESSHPLLGEVVPKASLDGELVFAKEESLDRFFYRPEWSMVSEEFTQPQDSNVVPFKETMNGNKILLVYPDKAAELAAEFKQLLAKDNISEIVLGDKTELLAPTRWQIDPFDPFGFASCLANIRELDQIYFLGGVNVDNWHPAMRPAFDKLQAQSVTALYRLAKALSEKGLNRKTISLKVLTNNVFQVADGDVIQPFSAGVIGLAKTLAKEYPNLAVEIVDLNFPEGQVNSVNDELKQALRLVVQGIENEREYAVRGGRAYKRVLKPYSLLPAVQSAIRQGGVYVILGGAGNVGLRMSRYLAKTAGARLVWLGRRLLDDGIRAKIAEVEAAGGTVDYLAVDAANEKEMAEAFRRIDQQHGVINGVIHSAMDFQVSRIQDLDEAGLKSALQAKIDGSYVLYKTLREHDVDFVVFFSSGESFTGNIGWGAYAAACNFQDAFALHLRQEAKWPVYVVNWGFWEGNERGDAEILKAKGIIPITLKQGAEALERILANDVPQVMALNVADPILERMGVVLPNKQTVTQPSLAMYGEAQGNALSQIASTQIMEHQDSTGISGEISLEVVSEQVKEIFAESLKIGKEKFDVQMDLANYGVDSLIVINLHKALEERMGTLPATLIIENQTIHEIAVYLLNNHPDAISKLLGGDAALEPSDAEQPESGEPEPEPEPELFSWVVAGSTASKTMTDEVSNERGIIEDVEALRTVEPEDVPAFFESYGPSYRDSTLRNAENGVFHDRFDLARQSAEGLVQLLMKTPSCEQVEVIAMGQGIPILFLPAVALTVPVWYKQFLHLREKFQLLVIHAPGYGLSQTIKEANTKAVATVFSEVLERLNLGRPVHVVGSCFGSIAATYLARFFPQQVSSLSLVGGFYDNSDLPDFEMANLKIEEIMGMVQTVSNSLKADFDNVAAHLKGRNRKRKDDILQGRDLLLNSQCANPLTAMKYLNEMLTLSTLEWLPQIQIPTQCIYGDLDTVVNPERSRVIHEHVPNSVLEEIPGAGHYPFMTHHDLFNPILEKFILEHESQVASTVV